MQKEEEDEVYSSLHNRGKTREDLLKEDKAAFPLHMWF